MLLLYVDDLFLIDEHELIEDARRRLDMEFEMKELGMMNYFLGMEVWKSADGIFLGKGKYAMEILKRFKMLDYKAIATPMEYNLKLLSDASSETFNAMMYHHIIGSLMYLKNTKPDILFVVNTLIQFLRDLIHVHLTVAKHVLRYLKGTVEYGIKYHTIIVIIHPSTILLYLNHIHFLSCSVFHGLGLGKLAFTIVEALLVDHST